MGCKKHVRGGYIQYLGTYHKGTHPSHPACFHSHKPPVRYHFDSKGRYALWRTKLLMSQQAQHKADLPVWGDQGHSLLLRGNTDWLADHNRRRSRHNWKKVVIIGLGITCHCQQKVPGSESALHCTCPGTATGLGDDLSGDPGPTLLGAPSRTRLIK